MTRTEPIPAALLEAAVRRRDEEALAGQVAALEADEDDQAELLAVAELMESLRTPG